jgi:hypothetical protein
VEIIETVERFETESNTVPQQDMIRKSIPILLPTGLSDSPFHSSLNEIKAHD